MKNWVEFDEEGLARRLERRGKHFAVLELLQAAWKRMSRPRRAPQMKR
jgi:gluconate kinase